MRRFDSPAMIVATHNSGKLKEIAALLAPFPVTVSSNAAHGLAEPDETAGSFIGNARIKALAAMLGTGLPALADDSGLVVDGLGGAPGVDTADWAETGTGRNFGVGMARVWQSLEACQAPDPRLARFCCTLVMIWPDGHEEVFEGQVAGQIVWPPRGGQGHGYDPIFQPDGHFLTFGEIDAAQKNRISHRANAFAKLVAGCFD